MKIDERKIEILCSPHPWDDKNNPYHWCIFGHNEHGKWGLEANGWSKTMDIAYEDAKIALKELNEEYPLIDGGE